MANRVIGAVQSWLRQTWADFVSSIDAGLLGAARFVGLLYGPIDRSLPVNQAWRKALTYRLAKHVGWRHALGSISYLLLMILVFTGVLLSFYYRPSVEEAYPSIQHIVSDVRFGWLLRDLHMWAASLIVITVMAHMGRVYFEAAYKPPRETNWTIGLLLLLVVLLFGATGYLLPWDQWAYWTVTEALEAIEAVPLVGSLIAEAAKGDVIASGATLSRFFAIHVIVLPWILLALITYHFTLLRRRGLAPPAGEEETSPKWRVSAVWTGAEPSNEGVRFFPHHLLRSFVVAVLVIAAALTLAILFPRPVGAPADPGIVPGELVSTWVPVDVSIALVRLIGPWGFALFTLMGLALAFLPLFDRGPERRWRKRPVATALGVTFFVLFVALWVIGRSIAASPSAPDPVDTEEVAEQTVDPAVAHEAITASRADGSGPEGGR